MPLEVIGAGFGRTGTNSLKLALEQLGFGPCHHMFEVRDNPEQLPAWVAASNGETVDWHQIFRGYRSQVDWPGARYWQELSETFPDAKVILSVRDPNSWFDSLQATIVPFINARGKHVDDLTNARAEMAYKTIVSSIFDNRIDDRDHAIRVYEDHVAKVTSTIPEARLLTFDVSDGWGPLCNFLGVEAPDAPFPRSNSSQEFVKRVFKDPA
jgi:hypothetical protein